METPLNLIEKQRKFIQIGADYDDEAECDDADEGVNFEKVQFG